ncbi:TIGR03915 family putative DNA repair protein [Clostridium thailandense]|uniref:TIGR03915 family putative DNA repair protein n=1 Tax=Clostridium thailandense TaxID=2794346 RepID=UPI00398A41AF
MICYIYDGSFEGLLTAIYESYYKKEKPKEIFKEQDFIPSFFIDTIYIKTDKKKADKVYNSIKNKISHEVLKNIFYVFLSELKESDTAIYKYLKLAFNIGRDIDLHMYNNTVMYIHNVSRKIISETHRMLGFIRFTVLNNNLYYAEMEPDYNILELIMPHFVQRFCSEKFIIHDRRRGIAALYNKSKWIITEMSIIDIEKIPRSEDYGIYEKLWKEYFNSIAIENRKNVNLQKSHMPKRYWKFITEMN